MKRPQGFDRAPGSTTGATPPRKTPAQGETSPSPAAASTQSSPATQSKDRGRTRRASASERTVDAAARHDLRRAEKARRAYERGEARRFTRRSRRRRTTWLVSAVSLLLVVGFVTGAVYSPLLSLKTIRIEGASRVSAVSVRAAIEGQIGRPLALVDFASITRELGKFPLIRSFVTETVPPDTLIIRIAERAPIATLATSTGFSVVDPAGIVIDSAVERQPGFPLIELGSGSTASPAFTAAVGVLLALPSDLLKKVDTVTAQTSDDVTLVLTGGQSVVWGSAEQSALKAKVLAAVITVGGATTKYDVSAPNHPVLGGN
ncbi:MAG: FtsQ-type POTRA domain-containing protein [Microbacteriaceae bacterium]|nr:FtsQ-type POTRA domain-containing protein [Microbacteriaceae bacterium]